MPLLTSVLVQPLRVPNAVDGMRDAAMAAVDAIGPSMQHLLLHRIGGKTARARRIAKPPAVLPAQWAEMVSILRGQFGTGASAAL